MWYVVDDYDSNALTSYSDVADAHTVLFKSENKTEAEAFSKCPKNKRFRYYEGYSFRYDEKENIWECVGVPKLKENSLAVLQNEPIKVDNIEDFVNCFRNKQYNIVYTPKTDFLDKYIDHLAIEDAMEEFGGIYINESMWTDKQAVLALKDAEPFKERSVIIDAMDMAFFDWNKHEKILKIAFPAWDIKASAFIKATYEGLKYLEEQYSNGVADNIISDDLFPISKELVVYKKPEGCNASIVRCSLINYNDTGYELSVSFLAGINEGSCSYDWTEEERNKYKAKRNINVISKEVPEFGSDEFWNILTEELKEAKEWWNSSDDKEDFERTIINSNSKYNSTQSIMIDTIFEVVVNNNLEIDSETAKKIWDYVFGELFGDYTDTEEYTIADLLPSSYGFVSHWELPNSFHLCGNFMTIYDKTDNEIVIINYINSWRCYIDNENVNAY